MVPPPVLWTIGHSNHGLDRFTDLVLRERIAYVIDVRSYPYSRHAPHFNREALGTAMATHGIRYAFCGESLGGRPDDDEHYDADGHALYGLMAATPSFEEAVARILRGASEHRLALVCSCGQPTDCHRRLLVGKVLCERGAELRHILPDGTVLTERSVDPSRDSQQDSLFGDDVDPWRSAQSVSHRRRLSASSSG